MPLSRLFATPAQRANVRFLAPRAGVLESYAWPGNVRERLD